MADRRADRRLHGRGVCGVDRDGETVGQPASHPAGAAGIDVRDHHPGALAGEALGGRRAEAGGAAGHEGDLAVEPHLLRHYDSPAQLLNELYS